MTRWLLLLGLTCPVWARPTESEMQELKRTGMCVGAQSFRQSFEPYVGSEEPVFITTDSILNGFHVLLEESLRVSETRRAQELARLLAEWRHALPETRRRVVGEKALVEAAFSRSDLVLAVAHQLLTESPSPQLEVDREVKLVLEAAGRAVSPGLGVPLDYERFRPGGFYAATPELSRYYRAVRWLQLVPFRWKEESEWLAFEMICQSTEYDSLGQWRAFAALGGKPENYSTLENTTHYGRFDAAERRQDERAWNRGHETVNDQLRIGAERNARILPPFVTPDMTVVQRILDEQRTPTGAEVWGKLSALPPQWGVFSDYLAVLRHLEETPSGCPPFMRGAAWKLKSRQTVLGGWAQMRHLWDLQGKLAVTYMGGEVVESGYVEPNPDFYAGLAELALSCERILASNLEPPSQPEFARLVRSHILSLGQMYDEALPDLFEGIWTLAGQPTQSGEKPYLELADRLEKSAVDPYQFRMALQFMLLDVRGRWRTLEQLCRRLETLSLKQLNNVPFTQADQKFVKGYGQELATVMLYQGNSFLTPLDDAPRVASFARLPDEGQTRWCAIGRPRVLYVSYPRPGSDVICRGVVMPYHEFSHPGPLNDTTWKERLDRENPQPEFYSRPRRYEKKQQ